MWRQNWTAGHAPQKAAYLSAASRLEAVQAYKQHSFDLLRLEAGQHVLEVGCGLGEDARSLAGRVGPTGHVTGTDIDTELLAQAQAHSADLPLTFEQADVYTLAPFAANHFDACRVDRMLQHLRYPGVALSQMSRVVRPGGWVVASEPDWDTLAVAAPVDPALTRRICHYWADTRQSGRIGRHLPGLMHGCGLINLEVYPISISGALRAYDWTLDFLALVKSAEGAADAGRITPVEAEQWRTALQEAERAGQFLAHLGGFTVAGQKLQ